MLRGNNTLLESLQLLMRSECLFTQNSLHSALHISIEAIVIRYPGFSLSSERIYIYITKRESRWMSENVFGKLVGFGKLELNNT